MKLCKPIVMLLLLPLVILLVAFGATKMLNWTMPTGSPFYVEMEKNVLLPWDQDMVANIYFNQVADGKVKTTQSEIEIILMVDNSNSMKSGPGSDFQLAKQVIANFIDNLIVSKNVKIGIIFFDNHITGKVPLTNNIRQLRDGLARRTGKGNGTQFIPALTLAHQWFTPGNTSKYLVCLTDGDAKGTQEKEKYLKANTVYRQKLLAGGVDVFMIGVGDGARYDVLRTVITDDNGNFNPNRILTCDDMLKLHIVFHQIGALIGNVAGRRGQLLVPRADKVFQWQADIPAGTRRQYINGNFLKPPPNKENPAIKDLYVLFARPYTFRTLMEARTFGIIKPFYKEVSLSYYDLEGNPHYYESTPIPYVLNITYATLFCLYLPALFSLLLGKKEISDEWKPDELRFPFNQIRRPGQLPLKFVREKALPQWIPTLVIGLGTTGRHVLTHIKQNISDALETDEAPVQLLCIDLTEEEENSRNVRIPGTLLPLDSRKELYVPSPRLRNVKDKIQQYEDKFQFDMNDPYTFLNLYQCTRLSDEILTQAKGSSGHANLARAYLYKELEQPGSKLLKILEERLKQLIRQAADTGFMQVVLVGNTAGGTGSGLIVPLTVLLNRMTQKLKSAHVGTETHLLLVENHPEPSENNDLPITNRQLVDELDTLSQAGRQPMPYPLVPGHVPDPEDYLLGAIRRRPYDNVYIFSQQTERPQYDLFPQVADSTLFFLEKNTRCETATITDGVKRKEGQVRKEKKVEVFSQMTTRSLIYPSGLVKEMVKILFIKDIFNRQIAIPGLTLRSSIHKIEKFGSLNDLIRHPLAKEIWQREMGKSSGKWKALILKQETTHLKKPLLDDMENFWSFLEIVIPLLLNRHIFSLTGLADSLSQLKVILTDARTTSGNGLTAMDKSTIAATITVLNALEETITRWSLLLVGEDDRNGLLGEMQNQLQRLETLKQDLVLMENCRITIGIDNRTPLAYQLENLISEWLSSWLDVDQQSDVATQLRKRCRWEMVQKGPSKPELKLQFFGSETYSFETGSNFTQTFMEKTGQLAEQFLVQLKEITVAELLSAYEKIHPRDFEKEHIAQQLHPGINARNLIHLYLMPHPALVRLNRREEEYLSQLKETCKKLGTIEELLYFPPSSNQYRLFTLQVTTLLRGKPAITSDIPFSLTGKLKQDTAALVAQKLNIATPPLLPFHYLALTNSGKFKQFVRLWLEGRIYKDRCDRLWKVRGIAAPLTLFKEDGLEEAAVSFVMSTRNCPQNQDPITVSEERMEELLQKTANRNPLFCWMKLYM
ncbi:MAG: VWA domain-containing protein, partial [bacterium]|nr:VWA domain-containing protein [bacterium]